MISVRQVALATISIAAAAFFPVANATATSTAPGNEEVVQLGHSFELGSGEDLVLAHRHKPVAYRVCVRDVPGVAPLKVKVDGKQIEVMDGSCADVVGAHITVEPSDKLSDRIVLGRFERVKE